MTARRCSSPMTSSCNAAPITPGATGATSPAAWPSSSSTVPGAAPRLGEQAGGAWRSWLRREEADQPLPLLEIAGSLRQRPQHHLAPRGIGCELGGDLGPVLDRD